MDVDRAPMLAGALHAAITRPGEILVDLAELCFCDSSGLNALVQARRTAEDHGKRLVLRAPRPQRFWPGGLGVVLGACRAGPPGPAALLLRRPPRRSSRRRGWPRYRGARR
ncbi:STAS domain-containing protein [Streptomyces yangpuensis]|uniref:STAS domain-containing protein n=1 Tax=Streptomyces yangpuensis TaxID=1648182 RepID=UPI0037133BC9